MSRLSLSLSPARAALAGALLAVVAAPRCSSPPASAEPLASSTGHSAPPVASVAPSVVSSAPAATASSAPAPVARPILSDAATFGCGKQTCTSGKQTCCTFFNHGAADGVCIENAPDDVPGKGIGYLRTQWEACDKAAIRIAETTMEAMYRCDESIDCGPKELCCIQPMNASTSMTECRASRGPGTCAEGEACLPDSPCRTPGTRCVDGTCRRK